MKIGQKVSIYQKPLTYEDKEGDAIIRKIHKEEDIAGHLVAHCDVEFEDEPGPTYRRKVLIGLPFFKTIESGAIAIE